MAVVFRSVIREGNLLLTMPLMHFNPSPETA